MCQELMFLEDNDLYHGTHGDTKGYFFELSVSNYSIILLPHTSTLKYRS
jgi:hypothetical protein